VHSVSLRVSLISSSFVALTPRTTSSAVGNLASVSDVLPGGMLCGRYPFPSRPAPFFRVGVRRRRVSFRCALVRVPLRCRPHVVRFFNLRRYQRFGILSFPYQLFFFSILFFPGCSAIRVVPLLLFPPSFFPPIDLRERALFDNAAFWRPS